jgi:hypothetical protein
MIDNKDKDITELWWEYLKRSERYGEFCQWWNQKEISPLPNSLKKYHQGLWNTYVNFGDVHSQSFEEWWQSELNNPFPSTIKTHYAKSGKCMVDYRTVIGRDINKIYRKFKKEQDREPNINELIHNLELYMTHWKNERAYLLIEYQHKSTEEISEEFHAYLREIKKDPAAKIVTKSIQGMKGKATIKIRNGGSLSTINELERYLDVYDYKKEGLTISEIANKIWTVLPPDSDPKKPEYDDRYQSVNIQSTIKRDLQKAKKIIDNVAFGYFPGDF